MKRTIDGLRDETFEILVIGGGITGAGVALDAALRGLRVALIDKGDFASGTSSASSKLVHGGLRYLEHGGLHLVYEALHERKLLLQNAPHLVHPLRFILPFTRDTRVPPWKWRAGLTLYDLLAGRSNLRRSRPLDISLLRDEFPGLNHETLLGGAEYYDAQMDDARLCVEVVRTASLHGARVANYVEAIGFERCNSQVSGIRARDRIGGDEFSIRGRQILNATGPWVDAVCRLAGDNEPTHLRPTKGVHAVVPGRGLSAAFLLLHPADGRVFFVIPWMDKTLLGTTDTECSDTPDDLTVGPTEIDYLLQGHNQYFSPPLGPSEVLGSFVGLRPLIRARPGEPSSLSREFRIFTSPSGLVSVAGGKYTTYRRMAEVVTDELVRRLGKRRQCRTRDCRLDGAPPVVWESFKRSEQRRLGQRCELAEDSLSHLIERYGRQAESIIHYIEKDPTLAHRIVPSEPDVRAELAYQRDHEMALYPCDSLLRRTRLGLFQPALLTKSWDDLNGRLPAPLSRQELRNSAQDFQTRGRAATT
jgi:glycerol-3-phosphate dehydrogenase